MTVSHISAAAVRPAVHHHRGRDLRAMAGTGRSLHSWPVSTDRPRDLGQFNLEARHRASHPPIPSWHRTSPHTHGLPDTGADPEPGILDQVPPS
jgi:hypothetical protein